MRVRLVASVVAAALLAAASALPGAAERSSPLLAVASGSLAGDGTVARVDLATMRVYVAGLAGRFAYVFHGDHDSKRRSVVDLERGAVVATRAAAWRLPLLLSREGPPWQG